MAELFDKEGNPVEGALTQDELEAKIAEEKAAWEEANKAPKTPPAPAPETSPAGDDTPEWAKTLVENLSTLKSQVEILSGNQTTTTIKQYVEAVDDDKKEEFNKKFESLTGYDNTPEGLQQKASDAYLLVTGQRYEDSGIDMRGFTGVGRGPVEGKKQEESADAKAIEEVFGITDEDKAKYSNK